MEIFLSSSMHEIVWVGKPWVVPAAIFRTVAFIVLAVIFVWITTFVGFASDALLGVPLWTWILLVFVVIWLIGIADLAIFRFANKYILRQDGLEVKHGILGLRSFVVTPQGFGDLIVFQSVWGRIFGYGDLVVNSQGERETRLRLVRSPYKVADTMRDIMGKPIVRVENRP